MKHIVLIFCVLLQLSNAWGQGFSQTVKLLPTMNADEEEFGWSVATSGNYMFVCNHVYNSSSTYIYKKNSNGSWNFLKVISGTDSERLTAVDGNTLIIGLPAGNGEVSIYYKDQGGVDNWGFVKKLTRVQAGVPGLLRFGERVFIQGDNLLVFSADDLNSGFSNSGKVFLFERNRGGTNNWGLAKTFGSSAPISYGNFGSNIQMNENLIVISEQTASTQSVVNVYGRNTGGSNNWGLVKTIVNPTGNTGNRFAKNSVLLRGNVIVVSASNLYNQNGSGYVYIFEQDAGGGDNWGLVQTIAAPSTSAGNFGSRVELQNDYMCISANYEGGSSYTGAVYVYKKMSSANDSWAYFSRIVPVDVSPYDYFGTEVTISDNDIIVSTVRDDDTGDNDGAVYIFRLNTESSVNPQDVVADENAEEVPVAFSFYPNPASKMVNVKVEGKDNLLSVRILNAQGYELLRHDFDANQAIKSCNVGLSEVKNETMVFIEVNSITRREVRRLLLTR